MWSTEYIHALPVDIGVTMNGKVTHPVLTFTSATGLQPVLTSIGGSTSDNGKRFLAEYNDLLHRAYPINYVEDKSEVRFSFRRFFFVATKNA